MNEYIFHFDVINFFMGLILGMVFGIVVGILLKPGQDSTQKAVSLLMFGFWLTGHVFAFSMNRGLPFFFDFMGAAAVGSLIGVNTVDILKSWKGKRT